MCTWPPVPRRADASGPAGPERGKPAVTPDGRYIVVSGRLWRASNPALPAEIRQGFVDVLMEARRAVRTALGQGDAEALKSARSRVQAAKEGLGERGRVWWDDGAPDLNRRLAKNTPYADWWRSVRTGGPGPEQDAPPQSAAHKLRRA